MSPVKLVIAVVVIAGLGGLLVWRQRVAADAEEVARLRTEASTAMADLNQIDADLAPRMQQAMTKVASSVLLASSRPSTTGIDEVIAIMDRLGQANDRALATSDAYLAREPQPDLEPNIAKIRRHAAALKSARDKLARLRTRVADGTASTDEVGHTVSGIGVELMVGQ
jgi:hypothetical protein